LRGNGWDPSAQQQEQVKQAHQHLSRTPGGRIAIVIAPVAPS
jgi:hypothetical protein